MLFMAIATVFTTAAGLLFYTQMSASGEVVINPFTADELNQHLHTHEPGIWKASPGNANICEHFCNTCLIQIDHHDSKWGSWGSISVSQHRRTCLTCERNGVAVNHNQRTDGWSNGGWPPNPTSHAHNFRCMDSNVTNNNSGGSNINSCGKLLSGIYRCVFNASEVCVGGTYLHSGVDNVTGQTMGDTMPGVGCGRVRTTFNAYRRLN